MRSVPSKRRTPPHNLITHKAHAEARHLRFDRVELAGAFGDLGTLLPIVVAMIFINKLSPTSVFLTFGLFYLVSGFYFCLPITRATSESGRSYSYCISSYHHRSLIRDSFFSRRVSNL